LLDRGVVERLAGDDSGWPADVGADRALGRVEFVGGDRVAPGGERPGAIVAAGAEDAARARSGRKHVRDRRVLAEAEIFAARAARRRLAHVAERARRYRSADVAAAAQPGHATEIEVVAAGGDPCAIGVDRGMIHDEQV